MLKIDFNDVMKEFNSSKNLDELKNHLDKYRRLKNEEKISENQLEAIKTFFYKSRDYIQFGIKPKGGLIK